MIYSRRRWPKRHLMAAMPTFRVAILCIPVLLAVLGVATLHSSGARGLSASLSAHSAAAVATPVVGVQDSSVDNCYTIRVPGTNRYRPRTSPDYAAVRTAIASTSWSGLNVHTARFSPPWDIADPLSTIPAGNAELAVEQACFSYWLAVAQQYHVRPEIAFKPDYNYVFAARNGRKVIAVPSFQVYRQAIEKFLATYSTCAGDTYTCTGLPAAPWPYPAGGDEMERVTFIAPWGEPDFNNPSDKAGLAGFDHLPQSFRMPHGNLAFGDPHCSSYTARTCGPVLAAQMWVTVHHHCPSCTVIAGDFSSAGGLQTNHGQVSYLATYNKYLRDLRRGGSTYHPAVWGLHPYIDVSDFEFHKWWCQVKKDKAKCKPLPETLVARFAARLHGFGYGSSTHIWLDEVSSFFQDTMFHNGLQYSRPLQKQAAHYLVTRLGSPGGVTGPGEPVVTQIYYFRYSEDEPVALIVGGHQEPVYYAIANRPPPQQ